MVQVLDETPYPGQSLINKIEKGVGSYLDKRNDEKLIKQLSTDKNLTDIERIGIASRLSPDRQKAFLPLYSDLMQTQQKMGLQQHEVDVKRQAEELEEAKLNQEVQGTINELADKVVEGDVGVFSNLNKLTSKGRETRAYFDELSVGIEKRLAAMVGKGALSEKRFAYLQKLLPNSNDTLATSRGKLKALAKEFKGGVPNAFQEEEKKKESAKTAKRQKIAATQGKVIIISPSGEEVQIPKDQLEAALASGGQLP